MENKGLKPLQLALYGMDERSIKMMGMYLKGPCKGIAVVVDEFKAEADVIDADHINAKKIIEERKTKARPIILLSLNKLSIEGTFSVIKPVQKLEMISVLNQVKKYLSAYKINKGSTVKLKELKPSSPEKRPAGSKYIESDELKKTAKHQTAETLSESGFSDYMGLVDGIAFSKRDRKLGASFNPKDFFLGQVQSALKTCKLKGRILQLNLGWKPLVMFPHSREIWLGANDNQLREFAGLALKKQSSQELSLSSIDSETTDFSQKMDEIYDMDHFLWKLAVWTSKGRYPETIDINKPVFLIQWPNFTRLIVTPHAMRIAALLMMGPRTAMDIADVLEIKPQYVFVFISAANVLGLVGQATRQVDGLIVPPEIKELETKGLLTKIIGRLHG